MQAVGQEQSRPISIAILISLLLHLPLLFVWQATPAIPRQEGQRGAVAVSLSAVPTRPPAQQTARTEPSPPARPPSPVPDAKAEPEPSVSPIPPKPKVRQELAADAPSARTPAVARESGPRRHEATPIDPPPRPAPPANERASAENPAADRDNARPQQTTASPVTQPDTPVSPTPTPPLLPSNAEPPMTADTLAPSPEQLQQLQGSLSRRFTEHFLYPMQARRRHWEGTVVLRVRILGGGRIDAASVAKSSGHPVLDQAALESLSKVEFLDWWGMEAEVELRLPVIYRLES